jgi:hypothetical protein
MRKLHNLYHFSIARRVSDNSKYCQTTNIQTILSLLNCEFPLLNLSEAGDHRFGNRCTVR